MAVGKDGRRVYVGIIQEPGGVDVIDTASLQRVKTIPTKGTIHNAYVTPDGKYVVAGSIAGQDHQRDRREDRRAGVDARDGSRRPADDVQRESGRLDEMDLRAADRLQRVRGRRFRDAQGDQAHQESGSAAGEVDGSGRIRSVSRHGRHLGRQDARRLQPVEQLPVFVLAAGPEARSAAPSSAARARAG